MRRKTFAAGAVAWALLAGSASASTIHSLAWTGMLTETWSSVGCGSVPGSTGPCTTVTPLSGELTISVASNLDGDYGGPDVSVSVGDVGYGNWGIRGPDGSTIELKVRDGWVSVLEAGGPAPNHRGWFSVTVVNGAGNLEFEAASVDPDAYLQGIVAVPEPEPATWLMLAAGAALLLATRGRRRVRAAVVA
jgi:hypothetical protein